MPRVSEAVDDTTPLNASRIDVAVRIGWLLRTSRSVGGLSLRQMSAELSEHGIALSAATLSRVESEGQRSPEALDGYALVLGLADGDLRSTVDLLCRSFPYAPPPPRDPIELSLDRFSAACEAVEDRATGGAWLTFGRHHAGARGYGLPRSLMEPYARRLADELERAIGPARNTRFEALFLLRTSAYGDLVGRVIHELVLEPGCQQAVHLCNVLAEQPSPEVLHWLGELLRHDDSHVALGGSYALQSMLVAGGLPLSDWELLVPQVVRAVVDAADHPGRSLMLAQLTAALPPPLQTRVRAACDLDRPATRGPTVWSRTRANRHYEFAMSIARLACARLGVQDEPLLGRLLFEALYEPRGTRMAVSAHILEASAFTDVLVDLLIEHRDAGPDAGSRAALLRLAAFCHQGQPVPLAEEWIDSTDPVEFDFVLGIAVGRDLPLTDETLRRGFTGDERLAHQTLLAVGMSADPRLAEIARDPTLPESQRLGARWWAERPGRVVS